MPAGRNESTAVFDVVVVGSGAAGMTAALAAATNGLRTLVVEKATAFGGSTARSGGGIWAPGNDVLRRAGKVDDPDDPARYLAHIVGDAVPAAQRAAYLGHCADMVTFVEAHTPLRFHWVPGYSDYYPEAPGGRAHGRSIEPGPLDSGVLGPHRCELEPPYLAAKANLALTQADYRWLNLIARHPRGIPTAIRVGLRAIRATLRRRPTLTMGQALAAGLRAGLLRAGVPVWLDTPLLDLDVADGRVVGVTVAKDGVPTRIEARRGVVLASGGFERNAAMRQRYQRAPIGADWTVGAAANTGLGIELGHRLGAALDLMDDAWWGPSIPLPRGPYFCLAERTLPGCILVDGNGKRFVNEAAPYVDAVHAMYGDGAGPARHMPTWLIADQRYRNRYLFAGLGPRQPFPGRWYKSGAVHQATSIAELAGRIDVPEQALVDTVNRFNGFAETGRDDDFHRGESAYDRYYGDPRNKPNPCLATLSVGPYYAVKIVPGDLGTKGGLRTDPNARVLTADGAAIPGLYAAGNASAAVMGRTYAGPGATLGPAMTFGYLAALDLAARQPPATASTDGLSSGTSTSEHGGSA